MAESDDRDLARTVARAYREEHRLSPGARRRLDERLRRTPRPRRRARWTGWLPRPAGPSLVPALAVLGSLAVVAAGTVVARMYALRARPPFSMAVPATPRTATMRTVRFELRAPKAGSVALVGDFNGWDARATPMRRGRGATWEVEVAVSFGRHVYAFLVDGERWVADPAAARAPDDGFGSANAVIVVDGGGDAS